MTTPPTEPGDDRSARDVPGHATANQPGDGTGSTPADDTPTAPSGDDSEPPPGDAPAHGAGVDRPRDAAPAHGPGSDEATDTDTGADQAADPADGLPPGKKPSGLRNPAAAVRGLGAGALAIEALVLLLAIQPIRVLGGSLSGWAVAAVAGLAVLAGVLAGMMRREWAWHAGTVLQGLVLVAGLLHWSLFVIGVVFGAVWVYVLHVRRTILG